MYNKIIENWVLFKISYINLMFKSFVKLLPTINNWMKIIEGTLGVAIIAVAPEVECSFQEFSLMSPSQFGTGVQLLGHWDNTTLVAISFRRWISSPAADGATTEKRRVNGGHRRLVAVGLTSLHWLPSPHVLSSVFSSQRAQPPFQPPRNPHQKNFSHFPWRLTRPVELYQSCQSP